MTRLLLVLWFAGLAALSLLERGRALELRAGRCSLDGGRIVPAYRVDLIAGGEERASFCCVRCALEWPDAPPDARWRVRDEITGEPLDSSKACFVESSVVTVPARHDRTHAFARWADALEHVAEHGGERVPDPFAPPEKDDGTNDATEPNRNG